MPLGNRSRRVYFSQNIANCQLNDRLSLHRPSIHCAFTVWTAISASWGHWYHDAAVLFTWSIKGQSCQWSCKTTKGQPCWRSKTLMLYLKVHAMIDTLPDIMVWMPGWANQCGHFCGGSSRGRYELCRFQSLHRSAYGWYACCPRLSYLLWVSQGSCLDSIQVLTMCTSTAKEPHQSYQGLLASVR